MTPIQFQDDARPTRETTIQFQHDVPRPARATTVDWDESVPQLRRSRSRVSTAQYDDGIYHMRAIRRATSTDRHSVKPNADLEDDDPGLKQPSDFAGKQVFKGRMLLYLAYQSIGVIYGDIGTSPLYVYSGTFTSPPSKEDLVGVLSIVLWSLIVMVTVKYILIILRMDNDGEGGTFSTYSLLSRYLNITNRDPREASLIEMKRYYSGDLESAGRAMRHGIEKSKFMKGLLKIMGVLAVSMVMSDGILTPAQSVLGAVQGIEVVDPNLSQGVIVGVTDAILVLLFLIQPFGTGKIAVFFAPVIIIWLAFNAAFGIYNLIEHDWTVLKAFNPGYAFGYLIRNKEDGWRSLGGVLLAFTGVEALFADLGAFSRHAIQLSWLLYTFPCLLLAYIGQAAYISDYPEAYSNPFFNAAPPGTLYPSLVIAILAAVVASQAIITATFQLIAQITKLSYCPQIKVVHTSKTHHGQLYVPIVNWLLMIGTILVASIYNNTTSLGNAYGVCVMFVTFFDTCMVSLAAIFVWRIPPYFVLLPWLTIACMDGTFLSSALTKVPDGAWFTLTLSAVIGGAFILWRFGKESQWIAEATDRYPTSHFVQKESDGSLKLVDAYGGSQMSSIKGFGVFFDKAGETTPTVFSQFAIKLIAAPEVMVFFHLRPLETPSVPIERRYVVSRLAIANCYRVIVRHGYMDEVVNPNLAALIYEVVRQYILLSGDRHGPLNPLEIASAAANTPPNRMSTSSQPQMGVDSARNRSTIATEKAKDISNEDTPAGGDMQATAETVVSTSSSSNQKPPDTTTYELNTIVRSSSSSSNPALSPETALALRTLDSAYSHQVLYILGKVQLHVKPGTNWFRRLLLEIFLWVRDNTRNKIANLRVPTERVIEVGFVKDI